MMTDLTTRARQTARLMFVASLIALTGCGLLGGGRSGADAGSGHSVGPAYGPQADAAPKFFAGSCRQQEDDGSTDDARLRIDNDRVVELHWQLKRSGREGFSCRFELSDFEQVKARPHVELLARDRSGCKLISYHDRRRRTLAPQGCGTFCRGEPDEDALPVVFDPRTGDCAR